MERLRFRLPLFFCHIFTFLNEAATNVMQFFGSQRTTNLGYFKKIKIKEPLVLGSSKPSGNYSIFMKEPPGTMKILFGRSVLRVAAGFMKWEQTPLVIYLCIGHENRQRTNVAWKNRPTRASMWQIFDRVNVRFGLGDPDIWTVYLKFGQQPNFLGNVNHGTTVGVSSPKVEI